MKLLTKTKLLKVTLLCTTAIGFSIVTPSALTLLPGVSIASAQAAQEQKTKRVPALREKVYSQLARAQKLADDGDVKAGLEALDSINERSSSMNSYEIAMMHNFYGFIYYNQNDLPKAIASFERVVAEEGIPETLRLSTTFSLAQLAMANSDYDKVIAFLDNWDEINTQPIPEGYYLLRAQTYYQLKDYKQGLDYITKVISLSDDEGKTPKENWLVLQRAMFYSLNQTNKVVEVLERMVKLYDKPEYWVQLSGMYGETGQEKKQLAVIEAAYQQGFLTSRADLRQLAQVYLYNGLAFKAAEVMSKAIDNGIAEKTAKNYAFVAEAMIQAKEDEKSIEYFVKAADLSDHGQYDQRLAEVYVNTEHYEDAADSARKALDKGGLDFESNAFVALGMAQYNLQNFDASILAFEQAEKHKKSQRLAKQWIKYVKREKVHAETLRTALL
ncbi:MULTISPECIES: tetratricopeptide repeat protein [Pseudoalteromonas]|jgi:tetratricopeptide (TPR) repeat protein|uniref:tetratricopeptide repeat protein n=1 Tax=Pseudoalteromonas TaxID=53246 RepID=UPI000C0DA207|nr:MULTISPECIES: CDC27 family protein [unclassified Pseudoalteromonas]MBL1384490.1 tetratricopeptide repeat protein [Colwellia sp.]UOB75498.1 tetratricopeptide repeat protein [Pseudoalteromonas sp. APM04]BBW93766.1 tetratricopeptide repeat protein [Pseudoalteromonas sp. PS1M3]|tara:strand:- start:7 stop:1335 length:1329 start_codon:yes stop_codon:yes gene_type:complete